MIKPVEFSVDNQILRGKFYIPEGVKKPPAVILFHGSGSKGESYPPLAEKLMNNGIFSFFFNFRGCGESDGLYREQTMGDALKDARRALDFLLNQRVDTDRIGVLGGSLGGDIATLLLPEYPVKSLVLRAPAASNRASNELIDRGTDEDSHNFYFYHPEKWEDAQNFKNLELFDGSLLIIKMGNDNIIPPKMIDKYYDSAINTKDKKLETIRKADHRLDAEQVKEFVDLSLEWFMMTL